MKTLLNESVNGSISQCDESNTLLVNFKEKTIKLSISSFITLKRKMKMLTQSKVHQLELNSDGDHTLDVVFLQNISDVLLLDCYEIFELHSLIEGAMVMIELNSILRQKLQLTLS